jgi:hypothetical protein
MNKKMRYIMNLTGLCNLGKLISIIFLSLIISIFIPESVVFSSISRHDCHEKYTSRNTNSIKGETNDSVLYATISVNGDTSDHLLSFVIRDLNVLVNAQTFCNAVGGQYFSLGQNYGLMVQYGKIISFALNHYQKGFAALEMVEMDPPAEAVNDTIMAPLNFLAQAIDGTVDFGEADRHLEVTVPAPIEIGDIIPEAKTLADALSQQNYIIQQGAINLVNAIELYIAGYQADCNGNNANYPYLMVQTPPCPEVAYVSMIPMFFTMRPDEAFVLIGRTPPECTYYSYRSYLYNRYFDDASPKRTKIYASLGDTQSLYNMSEGRNVPDSFNRFFMLISAADKNITDTIQNAAMALGINKDDIYVDVIPGNTLQMGLDEKADFFNFFHRAVLFNDPAEEDEYTNNPPLEFLRITPSKPVSHDYLAVPELRPRGTGSTEFHLQGGLEQLRQQIINRYIADYDTTNLSSYQWIPEGYEAIETRFNARGETRDALYLRTPAFQFQEDDIIVAFGVNHARTGKAVYCNVGIYGVLAKNGLGGVNNLEFQGTAQGFLADSMLADSFYVWKFARTAVDAQTFVIPPDSNHDYSGIDYGALAVMVFRSYVEPATKVGPAASEIIMDQAILFRPKSAAVGENDKFAPKNLKLYQNYPNPFNPTTRIKFSLLKTEHVKIKVYNLAGQMISTIIDRQMQTGEHEVDFDGCNFSNGIYFYQISAGQYSEIKKMILMR